MAETTYSKGLEGVIAAESTICKIDGQEGKLRYRGYAIEDLAAHSSFEEVTYLLLFDKLPTTTELESFSASMRDHRDIAPAVQDMIRSFPEKGSGMELLQSVIAYLSGSVEHEIHHSDTCNCRRTLHQVAQLPTVVATYDRFRNGKEYIPPRKDLSHGANFLYMLHGEEPDPEIGAMMDTCMVLHAEHGFNASTFTARVVASSYSTCYCSISAAVGSLNGFLHGGANERVMDMVDEIGGIDNIDAWLDKTLAAKGKVMGMGHRVYRKWDPRAIIIRDFLTRLAEKKQEPELVDFLNALAAKFDARMKAEGKQIYPNLDFFSGALYTLMGIPRDLFTPMFAVARSAGWLAHILEQRDGNRLYRPKCLYNGPADLPYPAIETRS
jgi:citrate synthase